MKKALHFLRSGKGQAMVEYAIVASFVVIAAFVPYVKWTDASADGSTASLVRSHAARIGETAAFLSLPCP